MPNTNIFRRMKSMMNPSVERNLVQEAGQLEKGIQKSEQLGALGIQGGTPSAEQLSRNQVMRTISGDELKAKLAQKMEESAAKRQMAKMDTSLADLPASPKVDKDALGREIDEATKSGISFRDDPELALKQQQYNRAVQQDRAKEEALKKMKNVVSAE